MFIGGGSRILEAGWRSPSATAFTLCLIFAGIPLTARSLYARLGRPRMDLPRDVFFAVDRLGDEPAYLFDDSRLAPCRTFRSTKAAVARAVVWAMIPGRRGQRSNWCFGIYRDQARVDHPVTRRTPAQQDRSSRVFSARTPRHVWRGAAEWIGGGVVNSSARRLAWCAIAQC